MKKILFISILISLAFSIVPISAYSEQPARWLPAAEPEWIYKKCQRQGDVWQFSGSVYDVSLMNIAVPLARASALSNLASAIGLNVNSNVNHDIKGSEIDGYSEEVKVAYGYEINQVAAYGVRVSDMHVEEFYDNQTGRLKYTVHILVEIDDEDLQKAKEDFSKRKYVDRRKPVMKSREDEGILSRLIRKVGL
jgi:hypothetical protein